MTLDLDPARPTPLYLQVVEGVRRLVAIGALRPGDRLPAVRELAAQLRLNRNTVARAVQELEAAGVVRTRVGQGTFVADAAGAALGASREALLDAAIDRLLAEAAALGVDPSAVAARVTTRAAGTAREEDSR
ncbi:MAG: GntR family transcriptional regulator [Acidobacteria bacterium]|jgi:GntR family transcriptional regulator|nr:GntR family transcriptional regulator [Acidobacteriota bacterium]